MNTELKKSVDTDTMLRILDGIDDVIYIADPDSYDLLYANKTFVSIWGDYRGKKCYKALQDRESPCPFCTNHLIFGPKFGETHYWDFQNEVNKRWYRCADKAILWSNGKSVRMELAGDITEKKLLEFELIAKNKELEALNELNARLFSIIAHDIRSPICQAKMVTDLFRMKPMSKTEFDRHLLRLSEKTDNLLEFIDDILHWAKYQSENQQKLALGIFSTDKAINQAILLYQHLIEQKKIKLRVRNIHSSGYADKDLYALIIRNLIQNAIKFTPRGNSITIDVEERGQFVCTVIEDTGVGMSQEFISKITNGDAFISTLGTESEKGSGLGLLMCIKYAQMQNGRIKIESELNKGTRIEFQVPANRAMA